MRPRRLTAVVVIAASMLWGSWGCDNPAELPAYASARSLRLIEDVGPDTYRARYLTPLGRESQPLTEFQRAALVEVEERG